MNGPEAFDPLKLAPEGPLGVHVLPVLHERLDLAPVVAAVLDALDPALVAVELPRSLEVPVDRALRRLPEVSIVLSQEAGEDALLWAVAPGDPLVEALRWAREHERRWALIDPDVPFEESYREVFPDTYSLWSLGPEAYLELVQKALEGATMPAGEPMSWTVSGPADEQREKGMAHRLKGLRRELEAEGTSGPIVAVVGAAHARRLRRCLEGPTAEPFGRRRRPSAEVRHLHPQSLTLLLRDPPLAHAAWELLRKGERPEGPPLAHTVAPRSSLLQHGLRVITGGKDEAKERRRQAVPAYAAAEAGRELLGRPAVDRRALGGAVWKIAAASYREQAQEEVATWQRRLFFDVCRRYSRVQGQLTAGLYEWAVAARGVADDNLAWEVFDAGRAYPWQEELSDLATAKIDGDELDLGSRKVRFRRRFFRVKQRLVAVPVRERPEGEDPADWLEGFDGDGICSYPKEDVVIEDYARFLQKKAVSILSAERSRTEPFSTSLLDGVDVRETLRNLHEEKIYVKELGRAPGDAGSVVVIFDEDLQGDSYPYLMTWHGEHDQESDMAFYATNPYEQVVGPGITRATYGGFMMTYPPHRVLDVWADQDYRMARSKAEVLVLAAIDYSEEKLVVHVAAKPPEERLKRFAAAQKKRLVHIPLASLSPAALKKLRVVHLLSGHDKRPIAKRYIW